MRRGPPVAARPAGVSIIITAASVVLLLQGLQLSSCVRTRSSSQWEGLVSSHRGLSPPAFLASRKALASFACNSPPFSRNCQGLAPPSRATQAATAAAAAAAADAELGADVERSPGSLSSRLDEAAEAHVRGTVAAAAAEGDGIVCISSKEDEDAAAAAAAAAGGAAATPEALFEASKTFQVEAVRPGGPHAQGGPFQRAPVGPLKIKPGGALEALSLAMSGGLEKAGPWLRRWKADEERTLPILLSRLGENAAVVRPPAAAGLLLLSRLLVVLLLLLKRTRLHLLPVEGFALASALAALYFIRLVRLLLLLLLLLLQCLGQKTVVQLPESQRLRFVEAMSGMKAAAVVLGYADADDTSAAAATTAAAAAAGGQQGEEAAAGENIVLVGFAAVAEPIDVRLLDSSGEVGLKIVGRVKVLGVQEADEQGIKVRALPWWDERRDFTSASAVRDTIGALHSLFDRCNRLELKFRQLQGRFNQAHLVSLRTPLGPTVSEVLADLANPSEAEIAEVVSFCAMDHHLDAKTRRVASHALAPHRAGLALAGHWRVDAVAGCAAWLRLVLAEIRVLKATQGDRSDTAVAAAAAAAAGGAAPHPAASLGVHQEEPEDVYAGPPTTFG
ncbi:hypothetical protein Emag_002856 [Eimeria magna]